MARENKPNPVIDMIFEEEPQIPDIDPYAHEEEISRTGGSQAAGPSNDSPVGSEGGAAASPRKATRRGRRKGSEDVGTTSVTRSSVTFSDEQRRYLDDAWFCYRRANGRRVNLNAFIVEMVERGLEAASPEVVKMMNKF